MHAQKSICKILRQNIVYSNRNPEIFLYFRLSEGFESKLQLFRAILQDVEITLGKTYGTGKTLNTQIHNYCCDSSFKRNPMILIRDLTEHVQE